LMAAGARCGVVEIELPSLRALLAICVSSLECAHSLLRLFLGICNAEYSAIVICAQRGAESIRLSLPSKKVGPLIALLLRIFALGFHSEDGCKLLQLCALGDVFQCRIAYPAGEFVFDLPHLANLPGEIDDGTCSLDPL